jgi:LMBR1 domain-containing protein 1
MNPNGMLVVGIVVLIMVVFVINIYLYVNWQHPEDKNESIIAKIVIVFGFQLSAVSVLMIPVGLFEFFTSF